MRLSILLDQFYKTGDLDQLLELSQATFSASPVDCEVAVLIVEYFRPLENGEHPDFRSVDRDRLAKCAAPVILTINWVADHPLADFRGAAIEFMGVLGWESFLSRLAGWAFTGESWERIGSIRALGKMNAPASRRMLELLCADDDAEIAAAATRAMALNAPPTGRRQ